MLKIKQCFAIVFGFVASSAWAGDFDGSKVMICAPATTMRCAPGAGCVRGEAGDVNIDRFLEIDVANKMATGLRTGNTAPIEYVIHDGGQLIMHGSQNARGWSVTISEETGEFTGTVSGEKIAFAVFGACLFKEQI